MGNGAPPLGVAAICYFLASPVRGVGIAIPVFVPPMTTAIIALTRRPADRTHMLFSRLRRPEFLSHLRSLAGYDEPETLRSQAPSKCLAIAHGGQAPLHSSLGVPNTAGQELTLRYYP
jgi:hypothetical protein